MKYNFDTIIDRSNTASVKWEIPSDGSIPSDVLPMWVADMDFETVPAVKEHLIQVAARGIYGYTARMDDYNQAVCDWFSNRFSWNIEKNWIVSTTGVVFALAAAVRAFTNEGDAILIQQPVYYPFSNVITRNHRNLVVSNLKECYVLPDTTKCGKEQYLKEGCEATLHYEMDFDDLERKIVENDVKMMILCNPHNPIGRVWTKQELGHVAEICGKYQVQIISDEIHCDFVREGFAHTPFHTLDHPWSKRAVICTAPSKTFNLAGLQASNIIISDPELRKAYTTQLNEIASFGAGLFGLEACKVAYQTGADWVDELVSYIDGNYQYVKSYIEEHLPKIKVVELQGTYLLWLDFRTYEFTDEELSKRMLKEAKIWVDDGTMFGEGGTGFMRLNLATPRGYVEQAMEQLKWAF